MKRFFAVFAALAALLAGAAQATAQIPYPNLGTLNPTTYTFTATSTGDVIAYFVGNGGAFYTESLGMLVNGSPSPNGLGLNNQTSSFGDSFDLGTVNAGDTLTFFINVFDPNVGNLGNAYSDPSLNGPYDGGTGINHVYSTNYDSGTNQLPGIPSGTYVGFEDLPLYQGPDYNYTDEQFVFTNTSMSSSPEPTSLALFGIGIAGLAGYRWRRRKVTAK
jgi:PEP-CTERM motif